MHIYEVYGHCPGAVPLQCIRLLDYLDKGYGGQSLRCLSRPQVEPRGVCAFSFSENQLSGGSFPMMHAHLCPARVVSILSAVKARPKPVCLKDAECDRLMAEVANVIPLSLLHMKPFELWLSGVGFHPIRLPFSFKFIRKSPRFLTLGPILWACHFCKTLLMDASLSGW